jgi:hypothetical protein
MLQPYAFAALGARGAGAHPHGQVRLAGPERVAADPPGDGVLGPRHGYGYSVRSSGMREVSKPNRSATDTKTSRIRLLSSDGTRPGGAVGSSLCHA